MRKAVVVVIVFACLPYQAYTQVKGSENPVWGPIVFVEIFGSGRGITLNVEQQMGTLLKGSLSGRFGFGTYQSPYHKGKNFQAIPCSIHHSSGAGKHHREIGIGLTYAHADRDRRLWPGENESLYLVPVFGYRFQKPSGGFVFKVNYTPSIILDEFSENPAYEQDKGHFFHGIGISLGYCFR